MALQTNKDGFLVDENGNPPKCESCGQALRGEGSGWDFESYAGTYTGMCYSCTNKGPFVVKDFGEGLKLWSFPPHCPSWRRNRETYFGVEGCSKCGGQGRIMVHQSFSLGGCYPKYCTDCMDVYVNKKYPQNK